MKECSTVSFKDQVIFAGIDVHKNNWNVNLRHCFRELDKFSMNPSPDELAAHLKRSYPEAKYRSVYEAGFSGFEPHRRLCALGIKNIVINPADVPTSGKERAYKSDRVDSRKLARELESGSLDPIYIPSPENLVLRNLIRRETQIVSNIVRIKNRIKSHFFFSGLTFSGWSGRSLKKMESDAVQRFDDALLSKFRELHYLRLEKLQIIRDEKNCLLRLNRNELQTYLQSIPGIGFRTALILQAELWEMNRFPTRDALSSYVGLAPHLVGSGEHEEVRSSGDRKKKELHYILIEAAWRAVTFDMEQRARYGALLHKGWNSQRAISVVAKKLLYAIHAVWTQQRLYRKAQME